MFYEHNTFIIDPNKDQVKPNYYETSNPMINYHPSRLVNKNTPIDTKPVDVQEYRFKCWSQTPKLTMALTAAVLEPDGTDH